MDLTVIARGVLAADKAQLSRALNLVEDKRPAMERKVAELLTLLARGKGEAHGQRVGLTGPPGVGKSTLVAVLARELRQQGKSVGVVAVDPSSARSGGALLGDRTRMAFDPADAGLFVRSLATQGAYGGLAHPTHAAVEVLAAAYDIVLVETVGVGQTETAVVDVADTVALVVQPGSGDVLQFLKAGVMEIPDLLVVNKADHGVTASRAASDLRMALSALRQVGASGGEQAVVLTSARDRKGIDVMIAALADHHAQLGPSGIAARRQRGRVSWTTDFVQRRVGTLGMEALGGRQAVQQALRLAARSPGPPLAAAQALVDSLHITRD